MAKFYIMSCWCAYVFRHVLHEYWKQEDDVIEPIERQFTSQKLYKNTNGNISEGVKVLTTDLPLRSVHFTLCESCTKETWR
jgi:hypothetical protein